MRTNQARVCRKRSRLLCDWAGLGFPSVDEASTVILFSIISGDSGAGVVISDCELFSTMGGASGAGVTSQQDMASNLEWGPFLEGAELMPQSHLLLRCHSALCWVYFRAYSASPRRAYNRLR